MRIYIYLVLCVLFWSGNFILGRFIKDDISPIELSFYRWSFVFIFLSPIFIKSFSKIINAIKSHFIVLFTLSFLGIAGFNLVLYTGLRYTTATNALIINSTIPIIIIILSFIFFKQKTTLMQNIGIFLSTFGVLYLVLKGDIQSILNLEFNIGDILLLISALIWGLYVIILRFKPKELNGIELLVILVFLGVLILLPIYLYFHTDIQRDIYLIKNHYYVFGYISIFASILSFYFWNKGIEVIGANKTGQFIHLMPLFGIILAYIFVDESLAIYHIVGGFLIGLGIYLSLKKIKVK
jgi:drug/metabolite transporter (DMT)-like permease